MPALSSMFKTISSDCNLNCSYCYYHKSPDGKRHHDINLTMLENFIPQYMEYVADSHQANLSWQGGEPTLAGLDFFRKVINLEAYYAEPPITINNVLQTNGTLLNEEWGVFLKNYNFLVGVSLDGPELINDTMRKDYAGNGTFRKIMSGINVLRRHEVDMNILCVIGPHNVDKADMLMDFFRSEGFSYLQFMPAMNFQSIEPTKRPTYYISPREYGGFLINLFNEWYENGIPTVSIRTFDNFIQSYMDVENDLCIHSDTCNSGLLVEHNGNIYPCDFYIHPDWKLGNIFHQPLREIIKSPRLTAFIGQKQPLPHECEICEWKRLCKSECFRNRYTSTGGGRGPGYFCESYKYFFSHTYDRIQILGERLKNYQRFIQRNDKNPTTGDPCPCESGKLYEECCGNPSIINSYLFQQDGS